MGKWIRSRAQMIAAHGSAVKRARPPVKAVKGRSSKWKITAAPKPAPKREPPYRGTHYHEVVDTRWMTPEARWISEHSLGEKA